MPAPENLSVSKQNQIDYHDDGSYAADAETALIPAYTAVDKYIDQKNIAVCFDDDETCITNYAIMLRFDFGWAYFVLLGSWITKKEPAFIPTQNFYNYAQSKGMNNFIITAREEKYRKNSEAELNNAGYSNYTLIMCPNGGVPDTAAWKKQMRDKIEVEGYKIIANVGDHDSDLQGGDYLQVKLPNTFY